MSDHWAIITMIAVKPKPNRKPPHQVYLYKRADLDKLREDLLSFSNRFPQSNPLSRSLEENWTQLKEALRGIKDNIPTKMTKENRSLPWINRHIQMIRLEWPPLQEGKTIQIHQLLDPVKQCRNATHKMQARSYDNYIKMLTTRINYGLLSGSTSLKTSQYQCSSALKASAKQIQTRWKLSTPNSLPCLRKMMARIDLPHLNPGTHPPMEDFLFTQPGIERLLSKLQPSKASGPNELPAHMLKETASQITAVVTVIFQQAYEQCILAEDWLNANVSVIYKKGEKASPVNYCPVSLTCILCKTMKHIVTSQIHHHFETYNILHPDQHVASRKTIMWDSAYQYPPRLDP